MKLNENIKLIIRSFSVSADGNSNNDTTKLENSLKL
jgi:hypothetical protein